MTHEKPNTIEIDRCLRNFKTFDTSLFEKVSFKLTEITYTGQKTYPMGEPFIEPVNQYHAFIAKPRHDAPCSKKTTKFTHHFQEVCDDLARLEKTANYGFRINTVTAIKNDREFVFFLKNTSAQKPINGNPAIPTDIKLLLYSVNTQTYDSTEGLKITECLIELDSLVHSPCAYSPGGGSVGSSCPAGFQTTKQLKEMKQQIKLVKSDGSCDECHYNGDDIVCDRLRYQCNSGEKNFAFTQI